MAKTKVLFFLFAFISVSANAQIEKKTTVKKEPILLDNETIDDQFEFIYKKSNSYKDYKVIKKKMFINLKSQVNDTLSFLKRGLEEKQVAIDEKKSEIFKLEQHLKQAKNSLDFIFKEKDSIAFFGIKINKSIYKRLVWMVVLFLLSLLILFIYKFKNSNVYTKQVKINFKELEEEFDQYRKIALEREQKINRKLRDEINRYKNKGM